MQEEVDRIEADVAHHRRALVRALETFQALEELLKVWLGARYERRKEVGNKEQRLTRCSVERKTLGGLAKACAKVELPAVPPHLIEVRNYAAHRAAHVAAKHATSDVLRSEAERLNMSRDEVNFWMAENHSILLKEAEALSMTVADLREMNAPPMPFVDRPVGASTDFGWIPKR